jgi:hypothetical protein
MFVWESSRRLSEYEDASTWYVGCSNIRTDAIRATLVSQWKNWGFLRLGH